MHPLRPSTAVRDPWFFYETPGEIFESSDSSGKWLIFRPPASVDAAWQAIVPLVRCGALLAAKVSTHLALEAGGYGRHVICIYTRDWQDVAEVQRVREVLRAAGFNERLGYKRDADTRAGSERYVYEG